MKAGISDPVSSLLTSFCMGLDESSVLPIPLFGEKLILFEVLSVYLMLRAPVERSRRA